MTKIERNNECKLSDSELDTVIGGAGGFRYYEMNGDTYASNAMWRAVREASKEKPATRP